MSEFMVNHHIHYKEIDGYDETIFISASEHKLIDHRKLFPGASVKELRIISNAAEQRSHRDRCNIYQKQYYKEHLFYKQRYREALRIYKKEMIGLQEKT